MAAEQLDIPIEQGATFKWYITINDPDSTTTPKAPLDLTGYTVRGQGRVVYDSTSPTFTFVVQILDQVTQTGQVLLSLTDETTAAFQAIDPATNEPMGRDITHGEVYGLLYSLYMYLAAKRDAAQTTEA